MDAERMIDELAALTVADLRRVHAAASALLEHYTATAAPDYGRAAEPHETYRQEYVKCKKAVCRRCTDNGQGHGPYWYAYSREHGKLRKRYIGKDKPAGVS
jgi:hypothetical protein